MSLLNSPWENVREIIMLLILQNLKQGFDQICQGLKERLF